MTLFDTFVRLWAIIAIIGASIPFIREQIWWLRAWTYARLQMFVICGLTACVYYVLPGLDAVWDKVIWAGLLLSMLGCLRDILPFTKLGHKQTRDLKDGEAHTPIRLMVGNVLIAAIIALFGRKQPIATLDNRLGINIQH